MNEFLKGILDGINGLFNNYGWSIMAFTLLIRLCLTPFDYKSRVSMRKMNALQPEVAKLQKKYGKDQEKLNLKMSELYKRNHVSPLSSCLPLLLSMPILFAMFGAMRAIANEQMVAQTFDILLGNAPVMEPWLWIKNLWMPDSPFAPTWPDLSSLQMVSADVWASSFANLAPEARDTIATLLNVDPLVCFSGDHLKETINAIHTTMSSMPAYAEQVAKLPGWSFNLLIAQLDVNVHFNGLFILPLVAASSQMLMTKLQPTAPAANGTNQKPAGGGFMKWFFPLFSLYICAGQNAGFSLYWVTANLLSMVQTVVINRYLDHKEKLAGPATVDSTGADSLK